MLVPQNVEVTRRLLGQSVTWADYARSILKQAHETFTDYGSRLGTGPWYITYSPTYLFKMVPILDEGNAFAVRPSSDSQYWIFEVIA